MDETKYVAIPVEPEIKTLILMEDAAPELASFLAKEKSPSYAAYKAAIAAAPTTHVAVKRETIRKCMALAYDAGYQPLAAELRALLSQKGE